MHFNNIRKKVSRIVGDEAMCELALYIKIWVVNYVIYFVELPKLYFRRVKS